MKRLILGTLFFIMCAQLCLAQKGIEKLTRYKIDSLRHLHVDTLLYYCSSCGECEVSGPKHNCYLLSGYTLSESIIIYQQHGKFYTLSFDCYNASTKQQLKICKSVPYYLSVIQIFNARDKAIKLIYKKRKFLPPVMTDGSSAIADIYYKTERQSASIKLDMPQDLTETWNHYFWFKNEVKLFKLIQTDLDKSNTKQLTPHSPSFTTSQ